jgi:hypothetical protein
MTHLSHSRRSLIITAGLLLVASQLALADGVPIVNPSFETPAIAPGTQTNNGIPGWTFFTASPLPGTPFAGVANFPASHFSPPSDGSQLGYLSVPGASSGTGIFQVLSTQLAANTTYTLSLDLSALPGGTCALGFCTVSLSLNTSSCGGANLYMTMGTNTVVLNSASMPAFCVGQPLVIQVTGFTPAYQQQILVYLDNVRLDSFPSVVSPLPYLHGAFGSFSLVPGETSRLKAYCDGSVMPVATCQATLEFHDSHGVLLSQRMLTLRPGISGFLDLPVPQGRDPDPVEAVPVWYLHGGNAIMSLEIFDSATMRTLHAFNWGDGFTPGTGNVEFGPVNLTRSDTGRTKAFCDGSVRTACNVTFAFFDASGRMLKESRMTLQPGTIGFADLLYSEAGSTDRTVEIRPMLSVGEGPAIASFALIEAGSGRTTTQTTSASLLSVGR